MTEVVYREPKMLFRLCAVFVRELQPIIKIDDADRCIVLSTVGYRWQQAKVEQSYLVTT